jgi:hypothetical protein
MQPLPSSFSRKTPWISFTERRRKTQKTQKKHPRFI